MATSFERPYAQARSASGLNILFGLWLVIAPWVVGFSHLTSATWNSVIVGAMIAIFALIRTTSPLRAAGLSWFNFVLAIWLVMSPFMLNFGGEDAAMWNTVIVGLCVLSLAAWSAVATQGSIPVRDDYGDE